MSDRITARLYREADGTIYTEYVVDGVGYPSIDALQGRSPAANPGGDVPKAGARSGQQ